MEHACHGEWRITEQAGEAEHTFEVSPPAEDGTAAPNLHATLLGSSTNASTNPGRSSN